MTAAVTPLPGWSGGDGNAAYLDKTLRHGPMEVYFDESVSWRSVAMLWFRAAMLAFAVFVFMLLLALAGGSTGMIGTGSFLSFVVFWLIFLITKLDEPIGEWRVVLADRAAAAPSVYNAIKGKLAERRLPIRDIQVRRTRTDISSVNSRMLLIDGDYHVYVSVFDYGTSLYLGWMMWRTRRGATLVGRFIADLFPSATGRLDPIDRMLRTERPRAMREVVHALCREGLHVAVEQIVVPDGDALPEGSTQHGALPPHHSAPTPVPNPPAPQYQPDGRAPWTGQ
jgi:hypothetical protein